MSRSPRPLAVGAAAALAVAAAASREPAFERGIRVPGPGAVGVRLDAHIYDTARKDLGDLRVRDASGRTVPYLIDRASRGEPTVAHPRILDRGWRASGAATAVLDFGGRTEKRRLRLRLAGDNFRRRVTVEGGQDGTEWTMLVDEAWVFAIPGTEPARYETVNLPENTFPLLRVIVHPSPAENARPAIEDAWVPDGEGPPVREETLVPRWSQAEAGERRETWVTLDLGARFQPFHAIDLDVPEPRFFRQVRLDARRDPPAGADAGTFRWEELARGAIHRLERDGRRSERLGIEARGRERILRLRVLNLDDAPLTVRGVSVRVPPETLIFEALEGETYRLSYGSALIGPPAHDVAVTGVATSWAETARPAALEPPRRLASAEVESPWTERHPALLWVGLLAVVAALGALTFHALRRAG